MSEIHESNTKSYVAKDLNELYTALRNKGYQTKPFPGALVSGHSIVIDGETHARIGEISGGRVTIDLISEEAKTLDKFLSESDL